MTKQPIRVLHAVGSLNRGGIETWLMNLLRLRSDEVSFDFILGMPGGAYEQEAKSLGCNMHYRPLDTWLRKRLNVVGLGKQDEFLEKVFAKNRYDAFHVHGDEFFGDDIRTAARAGIPVRVAHCHNTQVARGKRGIEMVVRRLRFRTIDRSFTLRYATDIVACSSDAGKNFMANHWQTDRRCKTLFCGVPLDQFKTGVTKWTRKEFRKAHRIPEDAIVIGHAGSMDLTPQKNHNFMLAIFRELAKRDRRYCLYMAGEGPRRRLLEEAARESGLAARVFLPGLCDDVPSLMVHGFDVHLLPSLFEGLPVVGLEAVAAGLYTVCSDTITRDFTGYFGARVMTVSLHDDAARWADRVEEAVSRRIPPEEGLAIVEQSPFSIEASLQALIRMYRSRLNALS